MKIVTILDSMARKKIKMYRSHFALGWHGDEMLVKIQGTTTLSGNRPNRGIKFEMKDGKPTERRVKL